MSIPDTRASLILRLSDRADVEAWDEFMTIYQPLVYRLAKRKGFQHTDAEELVQEVMIAVSRAVDRWVPDANRARFRTWLFGISRNMMINFLTRRKYQSIGTGNSSVAEMLIEKCDPQNNESTLFDVEFQREVFHWAANHVKENVKSNTWEAFWLSSVDGLSIQDVSKQLNMTVGSVYIARSRVIFQLRERAKEFEFISEINHKKGHKSERKDL